MSATASGRAPAARPGTDLVDLLADFSREQCALALDASAVVWRGFDALRAIQQQAARATGARHREAARRLRSARDPLDLVTIPTALWRSDIEALARTWQDLAGAALDVQIEAAQAATSHVFDAGTVLEAAAAVDALEPAAGAKVRPIKPIRTRR